jgi:hypothetical protein
MLSLWGLRNMNYGWEIAVLHFQVYMIRAIKLAVILLTVYALFQVLFLKLEMSSF